MSPRPKPSVSFIGGGALAAGMSRALARAGYPVREFVLRSSKPDAAVKTLARELRAKLTRFDESQLEGDVLWLAVPDDAIESCARRLARGRDLHGKVALHSAGALSSELLSSLRRAGASIGSVHPMMSFPSAKRSPELRGASFAVEGDAPAVRMARQIVKDTGGKLLAIEARHKALYHAYGAMIAPLLVAHLEAAERMARRAGLDRKSSRAAMKPIAEKVIAAFLAGGAEAAFSGPLKRGDVKTIEHHLSALRNTDEDGLYRELAQYAVDHIKVANRNELKKTLRGRK